MARCLYAGVPIGAALGYGISKFAGIGAAASARAANPRLSLIQTGAGIAALVTMMILGVFLARARSLQVRELREKLRSIEADL